jgi:CBS domain-containing protein
MKKYKKIPYVGSVMTPFPYFVDTDNEVGEVEHLMGKHHIHHIPVQQDGRVVGIVSERDLFHLSDRFLPITDRARIRARDIMADDPYIVAFDTPLNEVLLRWRSVISGQRSFFIVKNSPVSCRQRIFVVFWRRFSSLNFRPIPEMTLHNSYVIRMVATITRVS